MNILMISLEDFFAGSNSSGPKTHVFGLAQNLIPLGHQVTVATLVGGARSEAVDRGVRLVAIGDGDLSGISWQSGAGRLREINRVFAENLIGHLDAVKFAPDVVHAHDSYGVYAAEALAEHFSCPLIGTVHMLHQSLHDALGMFTPQEFADCDATLCGKPAGLIAVSEYIAHDIAQRRLRPASRISVIRSGLDAESISEIHAPTNAIEPKVYQLIFAGQLTAQAGLMYLLQSAIGISKAFPEASYCVVGGTQAPHLQTAIEKFFSSNSGMRAFIQVLPPLPREQLFECYRSSVAAIVPSVYEPSGYAALEPMSCGVPVIATRIGGLTELISDGVEGILIDCRMNNGILSPDVDQLTAAQLLLLRNPDWSRVMGQRGKQRVAQNFLVSQMVRETLELYTHHMLRGKSAGQ
jgi:glycosyltransferase involved in cell wall biosynthesis